MSPPCSSLTERALNIKNSALEVPEPEFKHLATLARLRKAFVVELASELSCYQKSFCVGFPILRCAQ